MRLWTWQKLYFPGPAMIFPGCEDFWPPPENRAPHQRFDFWLVAAACGFAFVVPLPAQAADATSGKSVFKTQCSICHSPAAGRNVVGPSLFGVVGRHTASVPDFHYSTANQTANLTWNEEILDKYLESPKTIVPGTAMSFGGIKDAAKRADVIAYLATLK